jgi:dienelactone hydrolase
MKKQEVEFKVGEDTLRGSIFMPSGNGPFPGVIFFHGSGGVGTVHFETAKMLSEHGIIGFAFNYRGSGLSEGKFEDQTVGMGVEDGNAAVNFFLLTPDLDKNRVGFVGGSFGGNVASMLINKFKVKSVVLEAPASYSPDAIHNQRDDTEELGAKFEESDSYKEISNYKGSLLVQVCEFDDVLPERMDDMHFDVAKSANKKEKYVIKGAKHRLSIDPPRKRDSQGKIISWFLETL